MIDLHEILNTQLHTFYGYNDTKMIKLCTILLMWSLLESVLLIDTVVNKGSKNGNKICMFGLRSLLHEYYNKYILDKLGTVLKWNKAH